MRQIGVVHLGGACSDTNASDTEACSQVTRWRRFAVTGGTPTVDKYVIECAWPDGTTVHHLDDPAVGRRCVQQRAQPERLLRVGGTLLPVNTAMGERLLATGHGKRVRTPPPSPRSRLR